MNKRVKFDFEIEFTNGGGIQGQDFRLDINGSDISDKILADYIVEDLRLLMVGKVKIINKEIISEAHKRTPINTKQKENFIDLSHKIEHGMVSYKGIPGPIICDYLSREESKELYEDDSTFQIDKIEIIGCSGTYLDSPFHRYKEGKDLSELHLKKLVDLEGIVINATGHIEIDKSFFINKEIRNKAVLVKTGWDKNWRTDTYYENHPFLTEEAAYYLKDCDVKLVGIDSMNIDNTQKKTRPVHSILLKNEILIVEHLCNLDQLPEDGFLFSAVPPKFKGVGTFSVRVFAKI